MVKGCGLILVNKPCYYWVNCKGRLSEARDYQDLQGWTIPRDWNRANYRCGSEEAFHGCKDKTCRHIRICRACAIKLGAIW